MDENDTLRHCVLSTPKYPLLNVHDVEEINLSGSLLVYNNSAPKNVFFIGSCRTVPLMFYYNSVCKERNVYSILVYKYPPLEKVPEILKNTDLIICENVEHFGVMNTNTDCLVTFFKHFKVPETVSIHRIPNLELRMFHYDVIHTFGVPKEEVYSYFLKSRERMVKRMIEFGYSDLWHDIDRYMYRIRLFSTFSHPTRILTCLLFKYIARKLDLTVTTEDYTEFLKHAFIEGNDTPIFKEDVDAYGISFPVELSEPSVLQVPKIHVKAIGSIVDSSCFM